MGKEKSEKGKGISRRDFVKKMVYVAPAVTTLIIPKYAESAPPCPVRCTVVCVNRCPPVCGAICPNRCPPICPNRCPNLCPPVCAIRCPNRCINLQ